MVPSRIDYLTSIIFDATRLLALDDEVTSPFLEQLGQVAEQLEDIYQQACPGDCPLPE